MTKLSTYQATLFFSIFFKPEILKGATIKKERKTKTKTIQKRYRKIQIFNFARMINFAAFISKELILTIKHD